MFRKAFIAGASAAVLSASLGSLVTLTATPAAAAIDARAQATWVGVWKAAAQGGSEDDYMEFSLQDGILTVLQWNRNSSAELRDVASVALDFERSTADVLYGTIDYRDAPPLTVEFRRMADGSLKMSGTHRDGPYGWFLRKVPSLQATLTPPTTEALKQAMIGTWSTPHGHFKVADKNGRLRATFSRPGGSTILHESVLDGIGGEVQRWHLGDDTSRGENKYSIQLAPDGRSFLATAQGANVKRQLAPLWAGTKVTAGGAASPHPSTAPKAGYTSCNDWCEVKVVSSEVKRMPTSNGKFLPFTSLQLAVHNTSATTQTLTSVAEGVGSVRLVGSAGAYSSRSPLPSMESEGPRVPGSGPEWSWPMRLGGVAIASGAESQIAHRLFKNPTPQNLDRLQLVYEHSSSGDPKVVVLSDGDKILCAHYAVEQELKSEGLLPYAVGGLPALCGGSTAPAPTPAPPVQTPPAPAPMPAPPVQIPPAPQPAPNPAPAPVPAPTPPTTTPSGPALAQAGVFHPLEQFDVRLDQAVAGRDGKVNVYVTVKNRSGKEKYVTPGAAPVTAQLTDAEGVSIRQGHTYRATEGEPENFSSPNVTLANGGELKLRFVIEPAKVHGPLKTVSLRETDKKALTFDIAHADPGPSPHGAPGAGGGAFKKLSKFDVRIDNIAPARDGKLEAFVTLRNPGREWLPLQHGAIKLSGSDQDGGIGTTISQVYSIRGERGHYDQLPPVVYVEPGQEARVRLIWDSAVTGPIKVSDGKVEQVFTAGG